MRAQVDLKNKLYDEWIRQIRRVSNKLRDDTNAVLAEKRAPLEEEWKKGSAELGDRMSQLSVFNRNVSKLLEALDTTSLNLSQTVSTMSAEQQHGVASEEAKMKQYLKERDELRESDAKQLDAFKQRQRDAADAIEEEVVTRAERGRPGWVVHVCISKL